MSISKEEILKEKKKLHDVLESLDKEIEESSSDLFLKEEELINFRKLNYEDRSSFDKAEFNQVMTSDSLEALRVLSKRKYYKSLINIKDKPYFASFIYKDNEGNTYDIYMALTYLKDKNYDNILYDWRSPICSLFYDYEVGPCKYKVDEFTHEGNLLKKRQYIIDNRKLISVFDNSLNIDDELLQKVIATTDNEKMKNIVNTIQAEQNKIIRNLDDHNLIVQGIAGSGKTSVALHRIAFLLYRIKNLSSNNVLIFSPNKIFSEYISNVLPELGEANTLETTFSDYLSYFLKDQYQKNIAEITNTKNSDGLSASDKMAMNMSKLDEGQIIMTDINLDVTIKQLEKKIDIPISDEEVMYYRENMYPDKIQIQLIYSYFAKEFGSYQDLNLAVRKDYIRLALMLKKKLLIENGYNNYGEDSKVYHAALPYILTGNVAEQVNTKIIRNNKFLSKIQESYLYQNLIENKYRAMNQINPDFIQKLLSQFINTQFTYVTYENPDLLGKPIEYSDDKISDELLFFLNSI